MLRAAAAAARRAELLLRPVSTAWASAAGPLLNNVHSSTAGPRSDALAVSAGLAFRRWSHCSCSGDLSLPPPQKVVVEYDQGGVDAFIAFADAFEEEFEGIHVDGVQVEGRPGVFDIKHEDGQLLFSGSSASLPDHSDLFDGLRQAGVQAAAP